MTLATIQRSSNTQKPATDPPPAGAISHCNRVAQMIGAYFSKAKKAKVELPPRLPCAFKRFIPPPLHPFLIQSQRGVALPITIVRRCTAELTWEILPPEGSKTASKSRVLTRVPEIDVISFHA